MRYYAIVIQQSSLMSVSESNQMTIRLVKNNKATCEEQFGKETAEAMVKLPAPDPYEMCFAMLYLADRNSDLVWLYGACRGVMAEIVQQLPWAFYEYDMFNDPAWNYEDDAQKDAKLADIPDWYALDYARKNDTIPRNLAQLVYEATGCLMPRDLHRYDHELKELGKFGLRQNKAIAILYCMNALGAAKHMKFAKNYDEVYMEQLLSEEDDVPMSAADNGTVQKTEEQKEIERLKAALHAAEREAANAKKKLIEQKSAA